MAIDDDILMLTSDEIEFAYQVYITRSTPKVKSLDCLSCLSSNSVFHYKIKKIGYIKENMSYCIHTDRHNMGNICICCGT